MMRLIREYGGRSTLRPYSVVFMTGVGLLLLAGLLLVNSPAIAQDGSPMHPAIQLLDTEGQSVLVSGNPISTMQTCGTCHDTEFIANHSFHSDAGLSALAEPGTIAGGDAWDTSPGYFGNWNPLTYRYLSSNGDSRIDMTTAEWIQIFGARHVGGGPAVYNREGELLTCTEAPTTRRCPPGYSRQNEPAVVYSDNKGNVETTIVDPETGKLIAWDWSKSGVVEMDCFLCHTASPNNEARIKMLASGQFGLASTMTLEGTGIVETTDGGWRYNPAAFTPDGYLRQEYNTLQDPTSANCGQCHGVASIDSRNPLVIGEPGFLQWTTLTTGQVISPQRIASSGLNLADKESLSRSWDVHAERVVGCTDCHYALNNPVYYRDISGDTPDHLTFDPRRMDFGEYLYRPLHQFARGDSVESNLLPELDNTMRRCESCHSIDATHDWLPYKERHTTALACESCHIPQLYAPAVQFVDWTVLQSDKIPVMQYRGIEGGTGSPETNLVTGYQPVLLPRTNDDGTTKLAPFNLVTAWYWIYGSPARPVPLRDLQAAWFDKNGAYHSDILPVFDANSDGTLSTDELLINTEAKTALIADHLKAQGLENPRIVGDVQPYSINHNVAYGEWATRECSTCHTKNSRLALMLPLADRTPGGVTPAFNNTAITNGEIVAGDEGRLFYRPLTAEAGLYILGHDNVGLVDTVGSLLLLGTLAVIVIHGGLRYRAARRGIPHDVQLRRVYMYSVYERQWHWLQTVVILGLIFTGMVIHEPDRFSLFAFAFIVPVHNILALILVVNAALAAFYHLVSGEIRQFLPKPYGFFNDAFEQAKYYLRGIFRGDAHPFEKTPERKLNPLQQMTYLMILNVLLPGQVITGALMWGLQHFPQVASALGGLPFLAPLHTLMAWLFATFIVAHVYLTTTGHRPLTAMKAMITGWEDVEAHPPAEKQAEK